MLRRFALPTLLTVVVSSAAAAQEALPPARDLIDKHFATIGGKDKYLGIKSMKLVATVEVPAQGIKADVETYSVRPNMLFSKTTVPGLGEISNGYDGKVAWTINPMQGPRVITGAELDAMRDQLDPENDVRAAAKLTSAETVEKTQMGGQSCYKVKLVWKSGRESFDCYSTETGLLVGQVQQQTTPMGSVEMSMVVSDYKDFGGIKRWTKMTQEAMGQQTIMTVTSVEYDKVDPSVFELPKEIKTLVEKSTPAKPEER